MQLARTEDRGLQGWYHDFRPEARTSQCPRGRGWAFGWIALWLPWRGSGTNRKGAGNVGQSKAGKASKETASDFVPLSGMDGAIRLATGGPDPTAGTELDIAAARVARDLASTSRRVIGLLPAGPGGDPFKVVEQLVRAMVLVSTQMAIVLDPEKRLANAEAIGDAPILGKAIARGVVAIAPRVVSPPGAKSAGIRELLAFVFERAEVWRVTFVDLTGCVLPGELLDVLALLDGIIVVGRTGKCTEADLKRASSRVPAELALGVVLVD